MKNSIDQITIYHLEGKKGDLSNKEKNRTNTEFVWKTSIIQSINWTIAFIGDVICYLTIIKHNSL